MWDRLNHDFGDQLEGQTLTTEFIATGTKRIREIESTCNCITWSRQENILTVFWKINVKRRERDISTSLLIEYIDGSIDELELKTHVIINNT